MTTLWNRLKYTIEADLHNLFDKKEHNNPIAMLNQYVREAEKQTTQTGRWLERQVQLKCQLEKELNEANTMILKRTKQLELAILANEEDLIAFAQQELQTYEARVTTLQTSITNTINDLLILEKKYEEMKHKVKDMKVRQLQLMGKENVTRAQHEMKRVLQPESSNLTGNRLATFEEMEAFIERLGNKINNVYEASSLERRLDQLAVQHKKNEHEQKEIV